jgi:hypothetical protein
LACSAMPASRAASASTSPSTFAVGKVSASAAAEALVFRASPVPAASRSSSNVISVLKSSNRRPKWANAASVSPACQDPMTRSPAELISHTVPSASTRPNRCGSLAGGERIWGDWERGVGLGPGRGPGPGPGPGPGLGKGLGVGLGCSSVVMNYRHLPFARLLAAHLPRIATPSKQGSKQGTPVENLTSIEAACCAERSGLVAGPFNLRRGVSRNYPSLMKQSGTRSVATGLSRRLPWPAARRPP